MFIFDNFMEQYILANLPNLETLNLYDVVCNSPSEMQKFIVLKIKYINVYGNSSFTNYSCLNGKIIVTIYP